jgi:hypothetical protein
MKRMFGCFFKNYLLPLRVTLWVSPVSGERVSGRCIFIVVGFVGLLGA